MKRSISTPNFQYNKKVIVGEGVGDQVFCANFCVANKIDGFEYAEASGFGGFEAYLSRLFALPFSFGITDIVLIYDSTDTPSDRFSALCDQVKNAKSKNAKGEVINYAAPVASNVLSAGAVPRVHAYAVPSETEAGGLETLCLKAAKAAHENGAGIIGWVDTFSAAACGGWQSEQTAKLRLQAFLSAGYKKKADLLFYEAFDIGAGHLIPLDGDTFADLRAFLKDVAALAP